MAGLVPQKSSVNGTIEVKSFFLMGFKPLQTCCSMQLQCLPMASLLLALGNPTVNYLSLDLEGAELEVLSCLINQHTSWLVPTTVQDARHKFQVIKMIPFDQLNIEVVSVEFNLLGRLEISGMEKRGKCASGFFLALVLFSTLTLTMLASLTSEPLEVKKMRL